MLDQELARSPVVMWVDADTLPIGDPPVPWHAAPKMAVAGFVFDEPCPHAISLNSGLFWVRGQGGKDLLASSRDERLGWRTPMPEESALGNALGLQRRGLRWVPPATWASLKFPVHRLDMRWLWGRVEHAKSEKALVYHAYGPPNVKPHLLRAFIDANGLRPCSPDPGSEKKTRRKTH